MKKLMKMMMKRILKINIKEIYTKTIKRLIILLLVYSCIYSIDSIMMTGLMLKLLQVIMVKQHIKK